MTDEIDKLVDAETEAAMNAPKVEGIAQSDKDLIDSGCMTKNAARELTEQIKATATATYVLIHRAHENKVWVSLGYTSWESYVTSEFDMSKSRSYQLINQAKVVEAIKDVVPDGTRVSLTEAQARDVEKALPKITNRIKKATQNQSPDEASATVDNVVNESRKETRPPQNDSGVVETVNPDEGNVDKEPKLGKKSDKDSKGSGVAPIESDGVMRPDENDEDIDDEKFDAFDDSGSSVIAVGYIFAYFDGLGDPSDTAKSIDEPDEVLKNTDKAIAWLNSFRNGLKNRIA
jgi:hypothetical protein